MLQIINIRSTSKKFYVIVIKYRTLLILSDFYKSNVLIYNERSFLFIGHLVRTYFPVLQVIMVC
jgi:hypothetical protein